MHAPAPPAPRTCDLPACTVELGRRQARFCSKAHAAAAGLRKIANPDTKPCELPGCKTIIVRNHGRVCDAEWERRKYCSPVHAATGRYGQVPQRRAASPRARVRSPRRMRPAVDCPAAPAPVPRVESWPAIWRPNAPGWDPDGPRCVAR